MKETGQGGDGVLGAGRGRVPEASAEAPALPPPLRSPRGGDEYRLLGLSRRFEKHINHFNKY